MRKILLSVGVIGSIIACSLTIEKPAYDEIGEGEYIEASGNISVAFTVFSYQSLYRLDSTLFDLDSVNAIAIAWVRDTLQNTISDAQVQLYIDSLLPVEMIFVDSIDAYVAPLPEFFGDYYIVDVNTGDGYLRAKFWNPTVGVDSVYIDNTLLLLNDTIDAPDAGDAVIYGLFPLDDRPVLLKEDSMPIYAPVVAFLSLSMDRDHSDHMKFYKGFASARDTVVFDSTMIERLFPMENTMYEFYIIVANIDTVTNIPPLDTLDFEGDVAKLLGLLKYSGVLSISDIYRFYVRR